MSKTYRIAGLSVKMATYGRTEAQSRPYLVDISEPVDIVIEQDPERIKRMYPRLSDEDCEYLATGSDFYAKLLAFNGFRLHSSAIVVDGIAYLFSATSGTGKSTHTNLWLKLFGDRAFILNDDKPALRLEDGVWYAYGTPWSGKTPCYKNEVVPLKAVVRLSQAPYNKIVRHSPLQAYASLMPSCSCMRWDRTSTSALHSTVEDVISKVRCWHLECLPDADAARICHEAVTK